MKFNKQFSLFILLVTLANTSAVISQMPSGTYISNVDNTRHELKMNDGYFIHSVYETSPPKFIKTVGGFAKVEEGKLVVLLEFNSEYERDSIRMLSIPFTMEDDSLTLDWFAKMKFKPSKKIEQDLDGAWLFATRGPDEGQERRGEETPRKTLKFLLDNRFQWIAYNTETMKFSGTGGGSFSSEDGVYVENIEFFSKDDSRVGAELKFNYELKGNDWHHTGNNSKGEPMYEIWERRE